MRRVVALSLMGVATAALLSRLASRGPVGAKEPPSPLAVGAVLVAASLPVLGGEAARRRDPGLLAWLLAAQGARFCVAVASHDHVHRGIYAGYTDTDDYDHAGRLIGEHLRAGRIRAAVRTARTTPFDTRLRVPRGTNLVRLANGALYALAGPSRRNGFVVFSWLGFWGLFLFYRAFVIAVPTGRARTYLRLLFFTPSLLFWTGSIGKEALMVVTLGIAGLGGARAVTGSPSRGLALLVLGAASTLVVRPRVPGLHSGLDLGRLTELSSTGSSVFSPPPLRSPRDFPCVAATVLFRPHPFETHNPLALAAAAEGVLLLGLSLMRARGAVSAAAGVAHQPYVGLSIVATAALVTALSGLANFGLLVRQRVPILPFYFVLLSIPPQR